MYNMGYTKLVLCDSLEGWGGEGGGRGIRDGRDTFAYSGFILM